MVDLAAAWKVLETEALGSSGSSIAAVPSGVEVSAGLVEVGVDSGGRRHVLIPLQPGEAFAEDRSGRGVQLWRLPLDGRTAASLVCLLPELNEVFERLAADVLASVVGATSPARAVGEVLFEWKTLLAAAGSTELLSRERIVGLLAELLVLEQVLTRDDARRASCWNGPSSHQHDFTYGDHAVEVKGTLTRSGRSVGISSIGQLDPFPSSTLHLAFFRFQEAQADHGETIPGVIDRLLIAGAPSGELYRRLNLLGYSEVHVEHYRSLAFAVSEQRVYDTQSEAFPRLVPSSFPAGQIPAGVTEVRYTIDLANEPPAPLADAEVVALWERLAAS